MSRSKRTVPYPILGENTLVLSETMVLTEDKGELTLMFRVGDTCAVLPLLIVCCTIISIGECPNTAHPPEVGCTAWLI